MCDCLSFVILPAQASALPLDAAEAAEAAVHTHDTARHELGGLAGQEEQRADQFLRVAEAACATGARVRIWHTLLSQKPGPFIGSRQSSLSVCRALFPR